MSQKPVPSYLPPVFGIGLPLSGNRSLGRALSDILGGYVYHGLTNGTANELASLGTLAEDGIRIVGAVGVYFPIGWLRQKFVRAKYILNHLYLEDWRLRCEEHYERAQIDGWPHPLWKYPLDSFEEHMLWHFSQLQIVPDSLKLFLNLQDDPAENIERLCRFLKKRRADEDFPHVLNQNHGNLTRITPTVSVAGV